MRKPVRRASDSSYQFVGPQHSCCYCGEPRECTDHAFPASLLHGAHDLQNRFRFVMLSACIDCNSRAGAGVDRTFLDRRRRIARSLRKAERRLISTPEWSDEELDELGPNLRSAVRIAQHGRDLVMRRLANLESRRRPLGVPIALVEQIDPNGPPFWVSFKTAEAEIDAKASAGLAG